ncbi:MAG: PHP domain-containing protein [Clostridia bacterium]|nr:PHP domain-containing protein [Clostridia bacterium]
MDVELYKYDIYPKVFPVNCETEITIRMFGDNKNYTGEKDGFSQSGYYIVMLCHVDSGNDVSKYEKFRTTAGEDGMLRVLYTAKAEGEHYVCIEHYDERETRTYVVMLSVYALEEDLACRIPLRGDFHIHTSRSDGGEVPGLVCANYRKAGYDFIVITDHHRYYPSLEAIAAYKDTDAALHIIPGEEVHLPNTMVHIVNAGGSYSVNGLMKGSHQYKTCGDDLTRCSSDGRSPAAITREEYDRQIEEIMESGRCDGCPEADRQSYAVCLWAFDHIKAGGGLAILAHPLWRCNLYNLSIPYTKFMLKEHPFDALEVLGGAAQPHQYYGTNGLQSALYYEEWLEGRIHPIVGSTDSHDSTEHNRNKTVASTIVFAHENHYGDIFASVKERYSVAVDTFSGDFRLVGPFRLQKYANFLLYHWYPIHDRLTAMDGEIMREYYFGEAEAEELACMKKKSDAMFKKYFKTI